MADKKDIDKVKKPIWKRWCLWVIVVFGILIIVGCSSVEEETVAEPDEPPVEEVGDAEEPEPEPAEEPEPEPTEEPEPKVYELTFVHIGVTPEEFRNRWNSIIAELGAGFFLDPLEVTDTDLLGFGKDWAVQRSNDWFEFKIFIHPDGYVGASFLQSYISPTEEEEAIEFIAMVIALIASVNEYDLASATDIALIELALDSMCEFSHDGYYDGENAYIGIRGGTLYAPRTDTDTDIFDLLVNRSWWNAYVFPH